MKHFTKLMMAVSIMAVLCFSCQKEGKFNPSKRISNIEVIATTNGVDDPDNSGNVNFTWDGKLLTAVNYVRTDGSTDRTLNYVYDEKNRISEISSTQGYTLKYYYDGKYMDKIDVYAEGQTVAIYRIIHDDSFLDEIVLEYLYEDYTDANINPFFFLPNEIAEEIVSSNVKNAEKGFYDEQHWFFSIDDKDISGMAHLDGSYMDEFKYQYDKHRNPLCGWTDAVANNWNVALSRHNIVSCSHKAYVGDEEILSEEIHYTYEYSGNYPISKSWSTTLSNSATRSYTENYKYE